VKICLEGRNNTETNQDLFYLDLVPSIRYDFCMAFSPVVAAIIIFLGVLPGSLLANSETATESDGARPTGKVETIVCIRHGEKPLLGLGQLTSKGLNRALALPPVLLAKFGKPGFIFAPDPNQVSNDPGGEYCYVRPLATIEPAAIEYGLPVNTHFGFKDITGLQQELTKPLYENATIFVVWEHLYLDDFVKALVKSFGGDVSQIPGWPGNDYDSIFVIRIEHGKNQTKATFSRDAEGLNNLGSEFPKPGAP